MITDCNLKFLNKFSIALFAKLELKLFYSTTYHLQIDGSSERINQTFEIALRFFIHAIENSFWWPKVLSRIQLLLNNTSSSTIGKTPNKIAYKIFFRRLLDLYLTIISPNINVARTGAADSIVFAFFNYKKYYDKKHQLLFIKVENWAMLKLYKGYLIFSSLKVTKKLTQQYISSF